MKFCPKCGTAVFDMQSIDIEPEEETKPVDIIIEDWKSEGGRTYRPEITEMPEEEYHPMIKRKKRKTKRSIPWMIVAIVSLVVCIAAWRIPSDIVSVVVMGIALAVAIVSLCMRAKFRAISIVAIVISALSVVIGIVGGIMYREEPGEPKKVSYGTVSMTIPAKYLAKVDEAGDQDTYSTRRGEAAIAVSPVDRSFSDAEFEAFSGEINTVIKEALSEKFTITGTNALEQKWVAGHYCQFFRCAGEVDGGRVICKTVFINNITPQRSIILANIYDEKVDEKYGNDFDEVVKSMRSGSTYISSGGGDNGISGSGETVFSTGGVDPQLKAALDEYEAFIDEYVSFMKKYQSDPGNALGMIADYSGMLARLAEFTEKIDRYDTGEMSAADYAYYIEVVTRVEKKMLDVAY